MATQRPEDGFVRMPEHEFEAILARAVEEGAKRALADVGLEGNEAALDIRDLRSMLDLLRLVRRTAVQTVVRAVTTAVLLALLVGVAIKLKVFGNGPYSKPFDLFEPPHTPLGRVSRVLAPVPYLHALPRAFITVDSLGAIPLFRSDHLSAASILPPSTVMMCAVVRSDRARATKASATWRASTSALNRLPAR